MATKTFTKASKIKSSAYVFFSYLKTLKVNINKRDLSRLKFVSTIILGKFNAVRVLDFTWYS